MKRLLAILGLFAAMGLLLFGAFLTLCDFFFPVKGASICWPFVVVGLGMIFLGSRIRWRALSRWRSLAPARGPESRSR